jgi:HPt (histidine-containing phosphotransfer) domain-containing protein
LEFAIASVLEKTAVKPPEPKKRRQKSMVDADSLLAGVVGDRKLLGEMISIFKTDYPAQIRDIAKGLKHNDAVAVQRAAHSLKGAIGNFQGKEAFEAARKVEESAATGDVPAARVAFAKLNREMRLLTRQLSDFSIRLGRTPRKSKRPEVSRRRKLR